MKIRKHISIILAVVLMFFISINSINVSAAEAAKGGKEIPTVTATADNKGNFINLKWTPPNEGKYYSYRLYSKESSEPLFQSIPSKDKVKVLNIYPGSGDGDYKNRGNDLQSWINEPAKYLDPNDTTKTKYLYIKNEDNNILTNSRGVIKADENGEPIRGTDGSYLYLEPGLIQVDSVKIGNNAGTEEGSFNNNPESYLKENGQWKYDVIMLGSWDCNAGLVPTDKAVDLFSEFINSGRGFLAGHDTIGYDWGTTRGLSKIRDKFNIKVGYWGNATTGVDDGFNFVGGFVGNRVSLKRKGLLTNYPWNIGELETIFNVPSSHSTSNFAFGDIWMTYTDNSLWPNTSFKDDLYKNANFYLTTWNNTAMIQTGHSMGKSTPDEQKILSNTLFYLAQVTEDIKWDDHKGQDLQAPTIPTITDVNYNPADKKVTMKFKQSEDVGSTYDYYVEATEKSTGDITKSDTTRETVTSGFKGYSVVVDQNPDTVPGKDNLIQDTTYTVDGDFDKDFYVHVAAVDNIGNVSEVSTYKYAFPTLSLSASGVENNIVTIDAKGKSEESSITKIVMPNGEEVNADACKYPVKENGTYTFSAFDKEGNKVTESIKVNTIPTNIDFWVDHYEDNFNYPILGWRISDNTQDYTYNVNGKKSTESDYTCNSVDVQSYEAVNDVDLAAPTKPDITNVELDRENNKTSIKFNGSVDNGTSYDYYVEAIASETGIKSTSEVKSIDMISKLKGYSIVVDKNADTIPDGTITTTSTEYTLDQVLDGDFYVHVAAVDNEGNISEVSNYSYSYPELKLTPSTTEEVKDSVTIKAEAASSDYGIAQIITPEGKVVEADSAEYTVDVNGTYTFTAVDKEGHKTTSSIEITNIVPDVILSLEAQYNKVYLNETVIVDLYIDNIEDIAAEDIEIKYDSSKLKFKGFYNDKGIMVAKNTLSDGKLRFLLASKGKDNIVNKKTRLLRLYFNPQSAGDALIDVTRGRVSDGIKMEKSLRDAECGETTINIVNKDFLSVNTDDEEFTLLDLAIIGRHYGEDPESLRPEYEADAVINDEIDDNDLTKVADLITKNPNYVGNK